MELRWSVLQNAIYAEPVFLDLMRLFAEGCGILQAQEHNVRILWL